MSTNSPSLARFAKVQQNQRVQALLMSKAEKQIPINIVVTESVTANVSTLSSPQIIKIYPSSSNKVNLLKSNVPKVANNTSTMRQLKSESIPSTSASSAAHSIQKVESSVNSLSNGCEDIEDSEEPVQKSQLNNLKRLASSISNAVPNKITKIHSKECCSCCRDTLETILQQQQEILSLLKSTPTQKTAVLSLAEKLDLLPPMPFNDINDFLDFDESLSNENVQHQFAVKLNRLIVSTEQKSVTNIMSEILSNELCKSISWIGVKDTVSFGTSNMVNMIVDIVQEHHHVNIDVIKSRIAEWLRRCGDRINNELRRKLKKMKDGYVT